MGGVVGRGEGGGRGEVKIWTGMSLGLSFLGVFLGAAPLDEEEGPMLTIDRGWGRSEHCGSLAAILDRGVFRT